MLLVIAAWFGPELWIALTEVIVAAGVDLALTVALAVTGKLSSEYGFRISFKWRRVPQFLFTNVLPYAVGLTLGAVLVRYFPELREEYLLAASGLAAWLAKDWRVKFTVLMGFKPPRGMNDKRAA